MRDGPFTPLGVPELEYRVARDVSRIASVVSEAMGPGLRALLLGGGYGRGEGGGVQDPDGAWRPYNDYDLFAVVRGVSRWRLPNVRAGLGELARDLEGQLGVEVELAPLRNEDLPHLPNTMMWCELFGAARVIAGDPAVTGEAPRLAPSELPLVEGIRYLTNRGALLLWTRTEDLPDDRRWKFVHKAWLAVGAALLIGRRQFRVGYGARHEALRSVAAEHQAAIPRLLDRHGEAVEARLRPAGPPDAAVLDDRLRESIAAVLAAWRWLEEQRLQAVWTSWDDYAVRRGLFAERFGSLPLLAVNRARSGLPGALRPLTIREHPRTLVSRVLPSLLASRQLAPQVRTLLQVQDDWQSAAERCLALWRRGN